MNYILLAGIISIIYGIIQYALNYKDMTNFNARDIGIVFCSSLGGLYAYEKMGKASIPKLSEVFTDPPSF